MKDILRSRISPLFLDTINVLEAIVVPSTIDGDPMASGITLHQWLWFVSRSIYTLRAYVCYFIHNFTLHASTNLSVIILLEK
jgi:hypothetical protein